METEIELLKKIYTCTDTSSKTLNCILTKVTNPTLRKAIITQINNYDKINSDAKSEISNLGHTAPKNVLPSLTAKLGAKINSSVNKTDSGIAEIIIKESGSDIINITKAINKNQTVAPACYNLGRKLIQNEEENIERIKVFL